MNLALLLCDITTLIVDTYDIRIEFNRVIKSKSVWRIVNVPSGVTQIKSSIISLLFAFGNCRRLLKLDTAASDLATAWRGNEL
jgi:hypothetical protein